jgi:hypothetical protein
MEAMLFSMQKFQILSLFVNPSSERNVSSSYAFAWSEGVYPYLSEGAEWHKPFEACFDVKREQLEELHNFLCDKWDAKEPFSFYQLEEHYGVRGSVHDGPVWRRHTLWAACRYIWLNKSHFDDFFWSNLLENGKCPSEAHSISGKFTADDIYFE